MDGIHGSPSLNGGQWGGVSYEQPHHQLHHHPSHLSLHSVHEEQALQSHPQTPGIPQHAYSPMAHQNEYGGYFSDHLAHSPGLIHDQDYRMTQAPDPMGYSSMTSWGGMVGTSTTPNQPQHSPTYMPPQSVHHIQSTPTLPTMPQPPASVPMTTQASTHSTHSTGTARRTLTDADRRQMCLYHEENPNVKQTVIGAMFGVERSTVSKVLRQKDKYLYPDDGSRSPVKRTKGKFPDIERALAVWVRNRRQDTPLTDEAIRDQAWHFAMTTGVSEAQFKANNGPGWLEKFKQKNNLTTVKGDTTTTTKGKAVKQEKESNGTRTPKSTPVEAAQQDAMVAVTPAPAMSLSASQDSHHISGSPESFMESYTNTTYKHPHHSVSTTSLSSMFTNDTANGSFSTGPASPASPYFPANHHSNQPSPGFTPANSRLQPPPTAQVFGNHRPRSQTFPRVSMDPNTYMSPPPSSDALTPKLMIGGQDAMLTPPGPSGSPNQTPPGSGLSGIKPSKEEARKALETLLGFIAQEPLGSVCDVNEYNVMQGLLTRLTVAANEVKRSGTPANGGFLAMMEGTEPALNGL